MRNMNPLKVCERTAAVDHYACPLLLFVDRLRGLFDVLAGIIGAFGPAAEDHMCVHVAAGFHNRSEA